MGWVDSHDIFFHFGGYTESYPQFLMLWLHPQLPSHEPPNTNTIMQRTKEGRSQGRKEPRKEGAIQVASCPPVVFTAKSPNRSWKAVVEDHAKHGFHQGTIKAGGWNNRIGGST